MPEAEAVLKPARFSRMAKQIDPETGRPIATLEKEIAGVKNERDDLIDLTGADTHVFPPPRWAVDAFVSAASGGGATYTPYRGDRGVRKRVASNLNRWNGLELDPDTEIILTPGTQAGLFSALAALVGTGTRVLVPDPDYMLSQRIVRYLGGEIVPLSVNDGNNIVADLEAHASSGDVLLFSNPNNPAGFVYDSSQLAAIAAIALAYRLTVIVDQLYARLVYDDGSYDHLCTHAGMRDRCVTLAGPSKTESLSGYRIGVAFGPAELIDRMEDVLCLSAMRAPAYAQHVLSSWLADDQDFVAQRRRDYETLRDLAVARLNEIEGVSCEMPAATSYVFPTILSKATNHEIVCACKERGVVLNPGYQFGAMGSRHVRICIAQDRGKLNDALDRIASVVGGFQ